MTFTYGQYVQSITFANQKMNIDGNKSDWENLPLKIFNPVHEKYRNENAANLTWDYENLYVIFDIKDKNLCINERGENSPRLYFNDGVEIYIDSKNDSRKSMDKNDYQFLLSISNEKTIFRGDKYLIKEGYTVPKDNENTNIVIQTKTTHQGTINQVDDIDSGFITEIAIPWNAIGIKPNESMYLKLDLCVNDVDTFTDIQAMPDTIHPIALNYINLKGKSEFGFPEDWTTFQLTGEPNFKYRLSNMKMAEAIPLVTLIMVLIFVLSFIVFRQYKKIAFLKSFPVKDEKQSIESNEENNIVVVNPTGNIINPTIEKLNSYIQINLEKLITVEDMANACNISIRQLQRLTKTELNLTPIQHLTILKLEKASEALKNTNLTIAEIAYQYNFSDPSYFGSVFKKYYGVSPAEWRKG